MIFMLIYTAAWLVWFSMQKVPVFRVDHFFTVMTFLMAVTNFNPFLVNRYPVSFSVVFIIVAVHFFFCVGFGLSRSVRYAEERSQRAFLHDKIMYRTIAAVSLAFSALILFESFQRGALPILSSFQNAMQNRNAHWQTVNTLSFLFRVENLLSYFAMMFVIAFPYARKHMKASILILVVVTIAIIEHSLLKGARASILLALIGLTASYISVYSFNLKKFGFLITIVCVIFLVFGGYFYISRNQDFAMAPEVFLFHNCAGAAYSELADMLSVTAKAAVLSSCYFSSPPHFFEVFLSSWQSTEPLALGGYNFSIISGAAFTEIRGDIFDVFRFEGFGGNPWATFARDAYIDFGWAAPLFAALLGAVLAWFAPLQAGSSYIATLRFGILACFAFFMPFMSPLVIRPIIYSMLFLAVFPALVGIFLQQRSGFRKIDAMSVR